MLNYLTQDSHCTITTVHGKSISGIYGGVETRHGDWSVLVRQGAHTLNIPMDEIRTARTTLAA